jgi:hypothetical protein
MLGSLFYSKQLQAAFVEQMFVFLSTLLGHTNVSVLLGVGENEQVPIWTE